MPNQQTNQKKAEEDSGGRGRGLYQDPCEHPCEHPCDHSCASLIVVMFVSTGLGLSAGEKEQPPPLTKQYCQLGQEQSSWLFKKDSSIR